MFVPKTIGCQPRVSNSKPGYCGTAAKAVALGIAIAMLSLPALGKVKQGKHSAEHAGRFPCHWHHDQQCFVRLERVDARVRREVRIQHFQRHHRI